MHTPDESSVFSQPQTQIPQYIEDAVDLLLTQKLASIQETTANEQKEIYDKVSAVGESMQGLSTEISDVKTEVASVQAAQSALINAINTQAMVMGIAAFLLLAVTIAVIVVTLAQRKLAGQLTKKIEEKTESAAHLSKEIATQALKVNDEIRAKVEGLLKQETTGGRVPGRIPVRGGEPPMAPPVDPVQEILARLNEALGHEKYAASIFRLVLQRVYGITGLQSFEPEGSYFENTHAGFLLKQISGEGAYMGYERNGMLYVFPNKSLMEVAQKPDRVFEGYNRKAVLKVTKPAVFSAESLGQWGLQERGQVVSAHS